MVALVAPIGCELRTVEERLSSAFSRYDYSPVLIKVSDEFRKLSGEVLPDRAKTPVYAGYETYMDWGDHLRFLLSRKDAAMLPVLERIRTHRPSVTSRGSTDPRPGPVAKALFLISSLKTPEEVQLLRAIYGDRLFVVAVFTPEDQRVEALAKRIRRSRYAGSERKDADSLAVKLLRRDERGHEEKPFGQNVRGAHALADLVVRLSRPSDLQRVKLKDYSLQDEINRFVDLLFGSPVHSPTRDEFAMYSAYGASLRSSSLSRQVGAAITTRDGQVVSLGSNESPKSGGGGYWEGDVVDWRTIKLVQRGETNPSDEFKEEAIRDLISLLGRAKLIDGFLPEDPATSSVQGYERLLEWQHEGPDHNESRRALIEDSIEFYREVHAEMLAITDAARRGTPIEGCVLVTTTFPCHDCGKHAVASGIGEVVYFQPYRKSRVLDLHADAVEIDATQGSAEKVPFRPFIGITPRLFPRVFHAPKRENRIPFDVKAALLRLRDYDVEASTFAVDHYDQQGSVDRETQAYSDLALLYDEQIPNESSSQPQPPESTSDAS